MAESFPYLSPASLRPNVLYCTAGGCRCDAMRWTNRNDCVECSTDDVPMGPLNVIPSYSLRMLHTAAASRECFLSMPRIVASSYCIAAAAPERVQLLTLWAAASDHESFKTLPSSIAFIYLNSIQFVVIVLLWLCHVVLVAARLGEEARKRLGCCCLSYS